MTERAQSWTNALWSGLFFGIAFGLYMSWSNGWLPPTAGSDIVATTVVMVVSGALFGLLLGLFMRSPIIPQVADVELKPGETVVHSGLANHFLHLEGRGGRLTLTNTHLVFTPHAVNVQRGELRIPLTEITTVAPMRTLGLVPNGIAVTLRSGQVERFAVNDRETWMKSIRR